MGSEKSDSDDSDAIRHLSDDFRHTRASEIRPAKTPVRQFTKCNLLCSKDHHNHHKWLERHPQWPSGPKMDAQPPGSSAMVAATCGPCRRALGATEPRTLLALSLRAPEMLLEVKQTILTPIYDPVVSWQLMVSLRCLSGS